MKNIFNVFKNLTKFEIGLWSFSVISVLIAFLIPQEKDVLTLISSLIGVSALIFVAKGYVLGLILSVIFGVFYGIVSFFFAYYGEMITYLGMSAPVAIVSIIAWFKHPYKNTQEVEVGNLTAKKVITMTVLTVLVTVAFYFILGALGNANLLVSTFSVTTSFLASYLSFLRSPYYAVAYATNDVVLVILWVLASVANVSYLPMVVCFAVFLINDIYAFINWQRIKSKQASK